MRNQIGTSGRGARRMVLGAAVMATAAICVLASACARSDARTFAPTVSTTPTPAAALGSAASQTVLVPRETSVTGVGAPVQAPLVTPTRVPPLAVVPQSPIGSGSPLEVKVGQLIMAGFSRPFVDDEIGPLIDTYHIGNVVLLSHNIGAPSDIRAMTNLLQERARAANGVGMLIATDQEGGRVIRLDPPFTQFPPAREIGCIGNGDLARESGRITGSEMRSVGINVDLAPDADVVDNPQNTVIGDRSFGTDAAAVVAVLPAYIDGLHAGGAGATAKHFPGHGSTDGDSHDGPVTVEKTRAELEATELPPFRAIAKTSDLVMMANVAYSALDPSGLPGGLSAPIVSVLRDDIGFGGVIITDDLAMGAIQSRWSTAAAAVIALQAGVDIVLAKDAGDIAGIHEAIMQAVADGRLSESRIDGSLARVLAAKQRILAKPAPPLDVIGTEANRAFVEALASAAANAGCGRSR